MDIREKLISSFNTGEHVLVAMSGGVDSSIVAWAAKEAGCKVTGVTLKLFETEKPVWYDAEKVANKLGINWVLGDFTDFFGEDVISPYIATYKRGGTPNPCNICNRTGKTKYLFDMMQQVGARRIATGHYAQCLPYGEGRAVYRGSFKDKDQSYYLGLMDPFHIGFMVYPLGDIDKVDVRRLAAFLELPVAHKRDSYDTCFLQGEDYRQYLERILGKGNPGQFTYNSEVVGHHDGVFNYTVGQRKGLELNVDLPLFVREINVTTGEIKLAEKKALFLKGVILKDCVFLKTEKVLQKLTARIRGKMENASCLVEIQQGKKCVVLFAEPQFAPAPGQITIIYDGDRVIGGGTVVRAF